MSRAWGPWTAVKLDALGRYLSAFTSASQRARATLYLDLFSGVADNLERDSGRRLLGSPSRALATQPAFDKLLFCELQPRSALALDAQLRQRYPDRDFQVLPGDCNVEIPQALAALPDGWRWAPIFAFLDQYSAEIRWSTLETLATYKVHRKPKIEQWLFFGDGLLPRGLHPDPNGEPSEPYASRVDGMFGTKQWREIWLGRYTGLLTPLESRQQLVNLMRWRLETVLGYKATLPLAVTNDRGVPVYTMIFATDHPVGEKIMTSVLGVAERALQEMRDGAKARRARESEEARGLLALFATDVLSDAPQPARSSIDPPEEPWRHPDL